MKESEKQNQSDKTLPTTSTARRNKKSSRSRSNGPTKKLVPKRKQQSEPKSGEKNRSEKIVIHKVPSTRRHYESQSARYQTIFTNETGTNNYQ